MSQGILSTTVVERNRFSKFYNGGGSKMADGMTSRIRRAKVNGGSNLLQITQWQNEFTGSSEIREFKNLGRDAEDNVG